MENSPSFLITIPGEAAAEFAAADDPAVRPAPGLRTDIGVAVDAISLGAAGLVGASTVVVAAGEIRQFVDRLTKHLRRKGVDTVDLADGGGAAVPVEVSEEALLNALRRLLAEQEQKP